MATARDTDRLPDVVPPLTPARTDWHRSLRPASAFSWLAAGWRDFSNKPWPSLVYGFLVFLISLGVIIGLFRYGYDYIVLPALSGFLVVAPLLATGLYQKSRLLAKGAPIALSEILFVKARSGGQVFFVGLLLCLLVLLWMRAAVLLWALFFGLLPFPEIGDATTTIVTTPAGWLLLAVGGLVGGLFAAFSFAVSVFSIPMLLDESTDALTAMGTSMALVWNNLGAMLLWGAIVTVLFMACLATGLTGLVVVFPVLGHATWHAYRSTRRSVGDQS